MSRILSYEDTGRLGGNKCPGGAILPSHGASEGDDAVLKEQLRCQWT